MKCPFCGSEQTSVADSRDHDDTIRRRRECLSCRKRFTTFERAEGLDLKVIKKDGTRESFDREKIRRGLTKATWKRPISMEQIENLIEQVEQKLRQKGVKEVKSWEIGNLIIARLKKIDKLSYLLFASVYRDFETLEDFVAELHKVQEMDKKPDQVKKKNQ